MRPTRSEARYTNVAIALHWIVALLVIFTFAWGWWMQTIPKAPPGLRADAFNFHKSIGLTILALMAVRLAWRAFHEPPPLPPMPLWQSRLAQGTHFLLYVALIVMPVAGYLGSVFSGYPVKYFGVTLPAWGWKSEAIKSAMSAVHLATSWVIAAAVVLHVAGALKHALIERDGLMRRMLPAPRQQGVAPAVAPQPPR
jgi:cytochrome b561